MKWITGIGSRQTPTVILRLMEEVATRLASTGKWTLRSGAAPGADSAFEKGWLAAGGDASNRIEIFVPWLGFENRPSNPPYWYVKSPRAVEIAKAAHPTWDSLSQGAQKLHTRNVFQVLGHTLCVPSTIVICWAPMRDGVPTGGTSQAIRIAQAHGVPVLNLATDTGWTLEKVGSAMRALLH